MTSAESALPSRRLMLVHAHPDDESINNGATMARYVDEGAAVTLVTCTLGEEGEVLVPDLAHLAADHGDSLGQHRIGELKEAMDHLGVSDFVRLGGDHRFRDSGMAWSPEGTATARDVLRDGTFWTTDLLVAANELVPLIRDRRPQVLITYNEIGGYGHPDHIQAHRVAMYGCLLAGVPHYRPDLGEAWTVDRVLWTTMSESRLREGLRALRAAGDSETFGGMDPDGPMPPMAAPDGAIVAEIDGARWVSRKLDAMRAHATQITPDGDFFRSAPVLGDAMWSHEYYRLAAGRPFPATDGWAD
ncbi:MAG TPA: N-acetyl-1-D-myo-inositol-2-amino-2-deoxy-alpha-D-glucopyranoside deacetylase, partial [Microlunatus sp.]|nr:N-acetyl-1-D-myo-inositol-2-amino-2-deoxy-alpha-D-glucopyranoside deacetylase [Microlunatus sp.]